jgi:hypothetical protein
MSDGGLPENFGATWEGGTLRVRLPEPVTTTSSTYDPVLTRRDARDISAWAAARERLRRERPELHREDRALEKVVLVRQPQFTDRTAQEFRTRLKDALSADGIDVTVAIEVEGQKASAASPVASDDGWGGETKEVDLELPDDDLGIGEASSPPPPAPPAPAPAPGKKPLQAPIPAKQRLREQKRSSDFELE